MNDDEKDKIVEKEESVSDLEQSKVEKQPLDESKANNDEKSENLPEGHSEDNKIQESKKEHQVIHKKEGRLHIYVRQDKYKGELKSKNWVGRIYIDGKQKISSSGTPNLEEAIPILEKWFEDIHAQKEKEKNSANLESPSVPAQPTSEQTEKIPTAESTKQTEIKQSGNISMSSKNDDVSEKKSLSNILEKFKSIKFGKSKLGKKETSFGGLGLKKKNKYAQNIQKFFKAKLGRASVASEEIVGVELTPNEIRLAQVSVNKSNQWILEKFYIHPVDLPSDSSVLDNAEKLGNELSIAMQKSQITTSNAAIAIPVTSAIIRVVTSPLMTDEELKKAIETNSLWENLVQLTDNLNDYSIFHQVINRNDKENTMDILFVASKLADINSFTSIIKNGGLSPVIIDVKCFALKSAVDQINQISRSSEDSNLTALLEFGLDENYVMILYDNNPIITDIFLRGQDRQTLKDSNNLEEMEALVRRYITQVKQAVSDFETKYEKRIRNLKVVSNLPNVQEYLGKFRKHMQNTGFKLFDPVNDLKVPQQFEKSLNMTNRSYLSTVIGLAFRKLDVFGYYKFVTAVKNINLLPNRANMVAQKKAKAFSNFAFKGIVGSVVGIYIILFALSFWKINQFNNALTEYESVVFQHEKVSKNKNQVLAELKIINKSLTLSNSMQSNKKISYRVLAQIASSVPKGVRFQEIEFKGVELAVINGDADSDQSILKLVSNLNKRKLIKHAAISSMKIKSKNKTGAPRRKGFRVSVKLGRKS
mgnify:FL=1|tara:strand:+ start:255 stop:2537 length:2283 start_codon:yes stop_codon:yes gene_type:complete